MRFLSRTCEFHFCQNVWFQEARWAYFPQPLSVELVDGPKALALSQNLTASYGQLERSAKMALVFRGRGYLLFLLLLD